MRDRDILLTGEKWTLAVNVALDDYVDLIKGMRIILAQIQRNIEIHQSPSSKVLDIHWKEISRLNKITDELETDLMSVSKLLSEEVPTGSGKIRRTRRGLINVFGYGLKYLFGTADAKDVKRLNAVCDNLQSFQEKVIHTTEQQMTYLHTLDESTKANAKATLDLAKALRNSIQNISLGLGRVEADLFDVRFALEKQTRYSTAIREIELFMMEMKFSLIQLQESLDLTSVGKLSSTLINPYNLSGLLQQVSLHLPKGTSMLTGLSIEDMYIYYAVATVHATATSRSIRLFIDLPLRAADRSFTLYQTHSLPFFHKGINQFIMIDEPFMYLAVADDRQFFTILTTEMLAKCTTDFYTICPSNMVLRKSSKENCLIALFTGKTEVAMRKCKRTLLKEFEPIWIRSPDAKYWVYSLEKSTHITLKCRPLGGSPLDEDETTDIWLSGNGVLLNTSTCYIYAENFKLLPHSLGRTVAGLNKTHIVLPSIETLLKPHEQELLQNYLNSSVHLKEIDDVMKEIISNKDRAELDTTSVLENLRQAEPAPDTQIYWIIGMSICIIIIIISSCCYHRQSILDCGRVLLWKAVRQRPIPQPRRSPKATAGVSSEYASTIDTVLPLNVIAAEARGDERGEEADIELKQEDRPLTPFVHRGRLPVV